MNKPKYFRVTASCFNSNRVALQWIWRHGYSDRDWSKGPKSHDTTTFFSPAFTEDQLQGVMRFYEAFTEAGLDDVTIQAEVPERWMPVDPSVIFDALNGTNT